MIDENKIITQKKVVDTPKEAFDVVNKAYLEKNGTTANRPTAGQTGRSYFDTTLGKPIWDNGTNWVDATGTVV